jgi:NlpC/P60 family putative phage cell wall peptidase
MTVAAFFDPGVDSHPPTRSAIVTEARRWIGTPYRHQASLCGVGADCLGLVRGVWRHFYGDEPEALPAYSADWAEATRTDSLHDAAHRHLITIEPASAGPGDVVLFRWRAHLPAKHAGILSFDRQFIHAYDGSAVVESPFSSWWSRHGVAAFAFPGRTD